MDPNTLKKVADHHQLALEAHQQMLEMLIEKVLEVEGHIQEHHETINGHARILDTLEKLIVGGGDDEEAST